MKDFFKYWAIGIAITTLIILLYFLATAIHMQLSFLNPEIAKIIKFAVVFGCLSIYFGIIAWSIMGNKD